MRFLVNETQLLLDSMRKELIKQIQNLRNSKVVVYFTGDRQPPPLTARIGEDAVRPLYDHLVSIGYNKKIDLFIYSRGGDVSVPWRIVSMFREFCDEFSVLIPYKAHSAATLLSLGADKIIMVKKAELSPIDPSLVKMATGEVGSVPQEISVEDVNSYISFMRERANINDQSALAQVVSSLANQVSPLTLGSVNRQSSHIRLVARKLLTSRKEKLEEAKITSIIETLIEKIYFHGHAVGRKEAKELGLPVDEPKQPLEDALWDLYLNYENYLQLNEPIDPISTLLDKEEERLKDIPPLAIIESENRLDIFQVQADFKKRRQIPSNPQININVQFALPPTIKPEQIPDQAQQVLQQLINQVAQGIPALVQEEIKRQSPVVGFDITTYGGKWQESREGA